MRLFPLVHVCWALVTLIALAAGYFFAEPSRPLVAPVSLETSIGSESKKGQDTHRGGVSEIPAFASSSDTSQSALTSAEVQTRAFAALAEPNRLKRTSALCEVLNGVSSENWRGALSAFVQQMITEGRMHGEEWNLVLERVGAVAGAAAVEDALAASRPFIRESAKALFLGWAESDATAADAWLRAHYSDVGSVEMARALSELLIAGAARRDSQQALALFKDDIGLAKNVAALVDGAIQRGGLREGEAVLAAIAARTEMRDFVKGKFMEAVVARRYAVAEGSGESLGLITWLEPYLEQPWASEAIAGLVFEAAEADAPAVMKWLEPRLERMPAQGSTWTLRMIAPAWYKQAPQQFLSRVGAPVEFVGQDTLAYSAAMSLLRDGKAEEVQKWAETFQSAKSRAAVEQALAHHRAILEQRNAKSGQ